MTRSPRRPRALAAAALACIALSSCGVINSNSRAFSIDGSDYPKDRINALVRMLSQANQLTVVNDQVDGKDIRSVLNVMIQYKSGQHVLENLGKPVTNAQRQKITSSIQGQLPPGVSKDIVDMLADINATGTALDALPAPTEIELRAIYESSPATTGLLCIREITVKTRELARSVVDQLAAGARFSDLAAKVSASKSTKTQGGAVTGASGEPCLTVPNAAAAPTVGNALALALLHTPAGANTGIVHDPAGWHVAVHRPFDEVKDTVLAAYASRPGRMLSAGVLSTSDISVNPVYGTWNPVSAKVE